MKRYLVLIVLGFILTGCMKDNPIEANYDSAFSSEAEFSELSMYNTAVAVVSGTVLVADSGSCVHDSLRNQRMLDSLRVYLSLTDDQYVQIQSIGATLFARLREIRTMVKDSVITKDSAKVLVTEARSNFVTSVNAVLTVEQQTLFATWIERYWNRPRHGGHGGHGGHGHHGGPGRGKK